MLSITSSILCPTEGLIVVLGVNMISAYIKLEHHDLDVVYGMMTIYGITYGTSLNGLYRVILQYYLWNYSSLG